MRSIVLPLFLPFFCLLPLSRVNGECISTGNMNRCQMVETFSDNSEGDSSIHWPAGPFGTRSFYFLKTSPVDHSAVISSLIRWRVPYTSVTLPTPINGFQLTVTDVLNNSSRKFLTHLSHNISVIDDKLKEKEFSFESGDLFDFGRKYVIEVLLLPRGIGGSSRHIRMLPEALPKNVCTPNNDASELAKYWAVDRDSIHHHILLLTGAVNVSFAAAPKELCIEQYSVQIHMKQSTIVMEYILNMTDHPIQFHVFDSLPRNVECSVWIIPYSQPGSRCVCTSCNCMTSKGHPFVIAPAEHSITITQSPPKVNVIKNTDYGLAFLMLAIIVMVLLCAFSLVSVSCVLKKRNKILANKIYRLQHQQMDAPLICRPKDRRLLLCASSGTELENIFVAHLAHLLDKSDGNQVMFDRLDWEEVEKNVHIWLSRSLRVADKIILVHIHRPTPDTSSDIFNIVSSVLPLYDERVIAVKLHMDSKVSNPLLETIFNFPRDIFSFCNHLQINFDESWKTLEKQASSLYTEPIPSRPMPLPQEVVTSSPSPLPVPVDNFICPMTSSDCEDSSQRDSGHGTASFSSTSSGF